MNTTATGLSRRDFLQRAGGGIAMLVAAEHAPAQQGPAARLYPEDFNAYLLIGQDGRVTVFTGKIEMGQGVITSLAQMAAEELGVDLPQIEMVMGDTDRCPWDMGTFGSLTTRLFGPALRVAAAQARVTLLALAAERLGAPVDQLEAAHGVVSVGGSAPRRVSYGELSRGARIAKVVDRKAVLRAAAEFNAMGRSPLRLDGVDKVTGAARYAADIHHPGMLHARLLRPPEHGATLQSLDTAAAEAMPGVKLVRQGDFVAVLHADPDTAARALAQLQARWKRPGLALDPDNIFDHLQHAPVARRTVTDEGDIAQGVAAATHRLQHRYLKGYVAHAPIEPHAAVAELAEGRMTVWASTQTPFPTRDRVAASLGMPADKVRVITPFVGGGFGGKSASAQAVEAARLARIAGRPVQVAWTRQEEFFFDTFDPAAVVTVDSGLDAQGRITHWDAVVYAAGERGSAFLYAAPHLRVRLVGRTSFGNERDEQGLHPFAVGPWRAPGANMNVFAIESQVDRMAQAAGMDPVAFRLHHLVDARMRRVLQAAASAFGWQPAVGASGRGIGVACSQDAGTCVASLAQVSVDRASGKVNVQRIVCAQDMGVVVNPEGARMQMEGALTMGLGYALSEELRFRGGEVLDRNFDTYRIPRFSDVPRIETVLLRNDDLPPQGGGEPAITTVGAVLANAVADAIGAHVDRLPLTPARVRAALGG